MPDEPQFEEQDAADNAFAVPSGLGSDVELPSPMTGALSEGVGGGAMAAASVMAQMEMPNNIAMLSDVEVDATVELGRTTLPIREVLKLRRGSVVELEKLVGQPADLMINNTPLAKGEVIVINERFGFRITKFITPPS